MTLATPAADPGPIADQPLAATVARGSFWMLLNAVVQRGVASVAQVALGWLLIDREYGLYALAITIASLAAAALRDGGVRQVLVQRHGEYERLIGPVFWMAAAFNTGLGLVLALTAPLVARWYEEPELTRLLLVIAVAQPLSTPGTILSARLSIDMRFREAGRIMTVSSLIRYLGAVVLALAGLGPLSFVLPLPILAIVEWAMAYAYTREKPWKRGPGLAEWWPMFKQSRWILVALFATVVLNLGASLVIKPFVSTELVGVYFFAFQIIVQITILVTANVVQVFFPAFTRMVSDPVRVGLAAARALRQLMLIASLMCLGLAVTFPSLEVLIWKGKWAAASGAVQALGALYPALVATAVPMSLQQAQGRFRAWALSLVGQGIASIAAAAWAAKVYGTPEAIAWATSIATAAVAVAVTWWEVVRAGASPAAAFKSLFPAWILALAAGVASVALDQRLTGHAPVLIRFLVTGTVFCAVFGVLVRVILSNHLRETVAVLPARVRGLAGRMLLLGGE